VAFYVSAEIEAGIDPVTVAVVLGHSTPQTALTTYFHYFHEARIKAGNAIAKLHEMVTILFLKHKITSDIQVTIAKKPSITPCAKGHNASGRKLS
jgi:hypothetical protein